MSNTTFAVSPDVHQSVNLLAQTALDINSMATGSVRVRYFNAGAAADSALLTLACFGDQ